MAKKNFSQPSSNQAHFAQVPSVSVQRSKFDRSHAYKSTFNAGKLIPVFVDEVLPGDTFHMKSTAFARLATPLHPVMDNMQIDTHFFFVPNRLVWEDFQKFMGERPTPDFDPDTLSVPRLTLDKSADSGFLELAQYFGLPMLADYLGNDAQEVSALPFRAYNLIFNEWYRDQNLQEPADLNISSDNCSCDYRLLPRAKRHDYFTSALPWPQKGDPVQIPIGEFADLTFDHLSGSVNIPSLTLSSGTVKLSRSGSSADSLRSTSQSGNNVIIGATDSHGSSSPQTLSASLVNRNTIAKNNVPLSLSATGTADLSSATAISINDLREAFQIQRLLERDARGGTRYIELILSHFGVRSDDARLQRPEFLGGGSQRISINPVANTAGEAAPQGNLAAFGTSLGNGSFSHSFTEHGFVIGLVSARADLTYQQGIERFWSRKTRYDFYWPSLSHLGEQAILNKELFYAADSSDDEVFGYQERYAEYRYKPSRITGLMSSLAPASLDVWHLAQDFANLPQLSSEFIVENPPMARIKAVTSEPDFILDMWFDLQCQRPMPVYSVPGLIDHF